ncbi:Glu/Leu/Phe/Val dehydrogenase [bacterium AH-315-K03]|nr:Glu/Leu/Phe/Val dehydrogenase [bacterium AH-315-K03]
MSVFSHSDFDHHELVAFKEDHKSGLKAIIAIHNTSLGPALGGCRMFPYSSDDAALSDVLRLSRGMTYKSALAGLPLGGGKAVIIGDPKKMKSRELLLAMGDFVESLNNHYITAEDSGTSVSDIKIIGERTHNISGVADKREYGGDPSPITAYGVYKGIQVAVAHKLGKNSLKGLTVAIQGIGNVGFYLARHLIDDGAKVIASDINKEKMQNAVNELGVTEFVGDSILSAAVDVLAPCAMGAAINKQTVQSIKAPIVAGAANNQLATPADGDALAAQGTLYAPDFVINAGGIIDCHYQRIGEHSRSVVNKHLDRIGDTLQEIFKRSDTQLIQTHTVAENMARERFIK